MTWQIEPYDRAVAKHIAVEGPNGFVFYVDFDDVDHEEVERMLPLVVDALNREVTA